MMVNGSIAAYFIGTKHSARDEPCLFVLRTGDQRELSTLKEHLPSSIDGIDVAVIHTEPFEAVNKR